jgi:hypothetical protein
VTLSAASALAGEITGNGQLLDVKGHSACANSGQEDLQWYETDADLVRKQTFVRGEPGHAQSWGQIPKSFRDFLTTVGAHPGTACNPIKAAAE